MTPKSKTNDSAQRVLQSHLLVDDTAIGSVPKQMQIKIGAYMTNLMTKTLKFSH